MRSRWICAPVLVGILFNDTQQTEPLLQGARWLVSAPDVGKAWSCNARIPKRLRQRPLRALRRLVSEQRAGRLGCDAIECIREAIALLREHLLSPKPFCGGAHRPPEGPLRDLRRRRRVTPQTTYKLIDRDVASLSVAERITARTSPLTKTRSSGGGR
jgi:hypothetical protein